MALQESKGDVPPPPPERFFASSGRSYTPAALPLDLFARDNTYKIKFRSDGDLELPDGSIYGPGTKLNPVGSSGAVFTPKDFVCRFLCHC